RSAFSPFRTAGTRSLQGKGAAIAPSQWGPEGPACCSHAGVGGAAGPGSRRAGGSGTAALGAAGPTAGAGARFPLAHAAARRGRGGACPVGDAPALGPGAAGPPAQRGGGAGWRWVCQLRGRTAASAGPADTERDSWAAGAKGEAEPRGKGIWQTKISSREKRHLRKERLKQKENPSRVSSGTVVVEAVCDGDGKGTIWPHPVSGTEDNSSSGQGALCESGTKTDGGSTVRNSEATGEESEPTWSEEDVFSNVGTWDIAEAKAYPVTFGTLPELSMELSNQKSKSSQDNPSKYHWNANLPFLTVDDAWLGQHDPLAIDLNSDWNAPTEEWGNWLGEEETCTGPEREKPQQGLEMRTEEGRRELISMKHSSHATCTSFKIPQDPANNLSHNDVPGKKERRKRKKMRKET
uniref:Metadherin n=1 Tax=Gopherus agassizii TaxID=38772 RepID=A0A452HUJ0_9SAUR